MRVLHYILALVFGLIGALSALRALELLLTGGGLVPLQVAMGLGFLLLAWNSVKNARAAGQPPPPTGQAGPPAP